MLNDYITFDTPLKSCYCVLWRDFDRDEYVCDRAVEGQDCICDNDLHVVCVCAGLWYIYAASEVFFGYLRGREWFCQARMVLSEREWILKGVGVFYYQESSEHMLIPRYRVKWLSLATFRKYSTLRSYSSTALLVKS